MYKLVERNFNFTLLWFVWGSSHEPLKYLWVQTPLEVERIIPNPLKYKHLYVPCTPKLIRGRKQTFEVKERQNCCYL